MKPKNSKGRCDSSCASDVCNTCYYIEYNVPAGVINKYI